MNTRHWTVVGLLFLVPASFVFATRFALTLASLDIPGWLGLLTGVGGALSAVGFLALCWIAVRTSPRPFPVIAGAIFAFVGHYVIAPVNPGGGGALVYAGTALTVGNFATSPMLLGATFLAGILAIAGALVRGFSATAGYTLGLAGTTLLAATTTAIAIGQHRLDQ